MKITKIIMHSDFSNNKKRLYFKKLDEDDSFQNIHYIFFDLNFDNPPFPETILSKDNIQELIKFLENCL